MFLNDIYPYLTQREIERLENVVARFIKARKRKVSQTVLYKMLAYIDNYFVVHDGTPLFLIDYKAMEKGPVPVDLYNNLKRKDLKTKYIITEKQGNAVIFINKQKSFKFNNKLFSPFEEKLLDDLFVWLPEYISAHDFSDASHKDIASWIKAWETRKENSNINDMHWIDTFDLEYNKKFKEIIQNLDTDELEFRKEQALESEHILHARQEV